MASFVNPKRVPQMADAEEVVRGLPQRDDVSYIGLALNLRGFERAMACNVDEVKCAVVASDTFSMRNQGATTEQTMELVAKITREVEAAGIGKAVTISAAFGCPFEGEMPMEKVVNLVQRLAAMGYHEISLADTIGAAGPSDVAAMIRSYQDS